MTILKHQRPKLKRQMTSHVYKQQQCTYRYPQKRLQAPVIILPNLQRKNQRRRKWGQHRKSGTHSDRCRQSPENTSLKCMSLSTILSGCRLQSPWPWPGRYLWAKSFKNKELSLCRDLPTDRGLWRPPTERAAQSFEANWKLQMQASKKGKLEGKKEDVAALSLLILFFLVGFFFLPPPPSLVWRTFGSSLSVTLNVCIWISENREQRHFVFFWWISGKIIQKLPPRTIIRMTDIIKRRRLFGGWKDRIQDMVGNVMQFTWVYFHGNNISPL